MDRHVDPESVRAIRTAIRLLDGEEVDLGDIGLARCAERLVDQMRSLDRATQLGEAILADVSRRRAE